MLTEKSLEVPAWVDSFITVAAKTAELADGRAATRAAKRINDWINDGPAAGLKRKHLFSRTATGWQNDAVSNKNNTDLFELDETEGISREQLAAALAPPPTPNFRL